MITLVASIFLIALAQAANAARQSRPLEVRIAWLQDRLAHHRYVCRRGEHATKQFACKARNWTARELIEAKAAQFKRLPNPNDWISAVRVTQRVYPGTEHWLLSCSDGEGGHGAWVRYGGGPYYSGYERTDAVGGWMQFRPSTYYAYVDKALNYARAHSFVVPNDAHSWFSPLGQALTAGYMRKIAGNSGWHWKASIDAGCR